LAVSKVPFEKGQSDFDKLKDLIINIAKTDPKSDVASDAIQKLDKLEDKTLLPVFEEIANALRFYASTARALEAIVVLDKESAYKIASNYRKETNSDLVTTLTYIFSDFAYPSDQKYFEDQLLVSAGYEKYTILTDYGTFLSKSKPSAVKGGIPTMLAFAQHADAWYERYAAAQGIYNTMLEYRLILAPEGSDANAADRSGIILTPTERADYEATLAELTKTLEKIKREEKNSSLKKRYVQFE
jgi:hypothetical protein